MFSEKDFERLWFLYKTEGEPNGVSINSFCIGNNIPYTAFHDWFKKTQKKVVSVEVEGIPEELIRTGMTILTRLLSLLCSRRTPTELPNRPQPYQNTPTPKRDACRRKKPQKPPRQTTPYSAWLTGKPSEPRARAWAMTAGRQSTT